MSESRPLRVFLCHASQDKPDVRDLYSRLKANRWIEPWLDEEKLLPGQDWDLEIYKAIRDADAIIICLSNESISKEGYVQKEFKRALDLAEEKPKGTIYLIPLRFDKCTPPLHFQQYQWLDYFLDGAHEKLIRSLYVRAQGLGLPITAGNDVASTGKDTSQPTAVEKDNLDLYRFVKIEIGSKSSVPYPFWIAKYPVTNAQYERFLGADYFKYWQGFHKFDETSHYIGKWGREGLDWRENAQREREIIMQGGYACILPVYWYDLKLGITLRENPVVGVTWYESSAYCNWLLLNWDKLQESRANPDLNPRLVRLPVETEWIAAAGGNAPVGRFPWSTNNMVMTSVKEVVQRANVKEGNIGHTTPVNTYQTGASPYGVMDMSGNVWEWQANYQNIKKNRLSMRGGCWYRECDHAYVASQNDDTPDRFWTGRGFRILVIPS